MYKVIIGVVIAAAVVIIGFMIIDPKVNNTKTTNDSEIAQNEKGYSYTIEGEVQKPGTYVLSSETVTMADLINAGGGTTSNADSLAYYEDATLKNGNTYYIASKFDNTDVCNNSEIAKVNINVDDADKLMTINGITSSIASSIVSYRTSNGSFKTLEQLTEVYGIGNATYRKIRNFVILHAWYCFSFSYIYI